MSSALDGSKRREREVVEARRRAGLVAAVAGLVLVPWFLVIDPLAGFRPESPPVGAPAQDFVDFYVDNFSRIPLNTTLFIGQWVILLVLLVAVVRAACRRLDLAAILATTLAGAATAVYVGAEGVRLWPVLAATDMTAGRLRDNLDPGLAQAAVLSGTDFMPLPLSSSGPQSWSSRGCWPSATCGGTGRCPSSPLLREPSPSPVLLSAPRASAPASSLCCGAPWLRCSCSSAGGALGPLPRLQPNSPAASPRGSRRSLLSQAQHRG